MPSYGFQFLYAYCLLLNLNTFEHTKRVLHIRIDPKYCGLEENDELKAYKTQDLQHRSATAFGQVIKVVRINAYA